MKKLCALTLFISFMQAQSTIVHLTPEEKILRDKVTESWGEKEKNSFFEYNYNNKEASKPWDRAWKLKIILDQACGINWENNRDYYSSEEYPDCKRVLEFLKTSSDAIQYQNPYEINSQESQELYRYFKKKVYDAVKAENEKRRRNN